MCPPEHFQGSRHPVGLHGLHHHVTDNGRDLRRLKTALPQLIAELPMRGRPQQMVLPLL
jgi:hypothetical protein